MTTNYRADPDDAIAYRAAGWWGDDTIATVVARATEEHISVTKRFINQHLGAGAGSNLHQLSGRFILSLNGCAIPCAKLFAGK
jgi:uncharacterized metal-binding protein